MNHWDTAELEAVVECLVFASETPITAGQISEALEMDHEDVSRVLSGLMEKYQKERCGFLLCEVAGGFQFRTQPEFAHWVRQLNKGRAFRFSRAALETLAIVAYRQPITRAEIEYLRGVDSGGVVKTLLDKHLIRILGRKNVPGRPMMYGTTPDFLEVFGLRSLEELPTLKEFSELDHGNSASTGGEDSPEDL